MNEATKQFFVKLYLQQAANADYVDWAFACLEEDFDSKSLRLLAGLNKNHSIKADFEELFRQAISELGWNYPNEKEVLLNHSKEIAKKILSGEIKEAKGCELINDIYFELGFPPELEVWTYLDGGHSTEWYDRIWWIPFMQKFNQKNWFEAVRREAENLAKTNFS